MRLQYTLMSTVSRCPNRRQGRYHQRLVSLGQLCFVERAQSDPEKSAKILLRVFFCTGPGRKIILLLSGYDKGKDPSGRRQQREIVKARKLYTAHCEVLKRGRKRA